MFQAAEWFELLAKFARDLARGRDPADALELLAQDVHHHLGDVDVRVWLFTDDLLHLVAASGSRFGGLDGFETERRAGPGLDAARSGTAVLVGDLHHCLSRWPEYVQDAEKAGIAAVAALPLRSSEAPLGALCLYFASPLTWRADDAATAARFADLVATQLEHAARHSAQDVLIGQLREALERRVVIEQAKGIIAAKRSVGVETAFEIMRKYARDRNASVHVVASSVVKLGLLP